MATETHDCRILVIGSGPSGASTAARLAEAGHDVLLVEEGRELPIGSSRSYSLGEMDQKYRHGGLTTTFGKPNVTYIEGRCVGGASEINAGLYHRPMGSTLREWQLKYQISDFGEEELGPHFDQVEADLSVSTRVGGVGPASLKLKEGADRMGWRSREIARFWKYVPKEGGGVRGERQSMTRTMIPRLRAAGGRILTQTRIRHLELDGRRAVAAHGHSDSEGRSRKIRIRFERVIVCAGAVQTPLLLRRSGITHNVGDALRMHPMIRIAVRFEDRLNDPSYGVPVHQVEEFKPHITLGCSHSSLPHLAMWMGPGVAQKAKVLEDWERMGVFYVAVAGGGKGSVRQVPMMDQPFVRYPMLDSDLALLGEGLHKLGQLLFSVGATHIYNPVDGGPVITRASGLDPIRTNLPPDKINVSTIHLFSTCPMGEDPRACATDSWGQLNSADNIWVFDASILPHSPGVNPQGTIMAIAHRNTLHLAEEL